ncbi:threonylcarbamoyl-AMP synthase [Candidatus Woesearchaeota archaeon]|nr:threonylcarbamoyl-AMP synthase [Candidatus Woesearchaeota archaeon]
MDISTKEEALKNKAAILKRIKEGQVFIYPTDTVYGLGCDATNEASVKRIRELKNRDAKPFSVIAPSLDWIKQNCEANEKWLLKLPGPYTLILPLKKPVVAKSTNYGLNSLGVRIPGHWISSFVEALNIPIVTTSVNLANQPPVNDLDSLKRFRVDFIIFEGPKKAKPSTVVNLLEKEKIVR